LDGTDAARQGTMQPVGIEALILLLVVIVIFWVAFQSDV
jgi:hypothetical protein